VRLGSAETPIVKKELFMSSGSTVLMDAAGRRRSPARLPGYLAGRAPHNKGMQFPPDPPRPEEIVVMRQAGHDRHGLRLRALIAVFWRAGLRISEAGTTSTYLQGIDPSEIIDAVRSRRQPTISATAGLTL